MDITTFIQMLRSASAEIASGNSLAGEKIAEIVQRITELECEEGGPYGAFTAEGLLERDIGLNLAVAEFLAANDLQLPQLDAFIGAELATKVAASEYVSPEELADLIQRYATRNIPTDAEPSSVFTDAEAPIIALIEEVAKKRLALLSEDVRSKAMMVLQKTLASNVDKQIALMPYYLREALGTAGMVCSDEYVAQLGFVNFCFWSSTIIYDDFWDEDEAADPQLLPIANLFAREYTDYFVRAFPVERGFRSFFHAAMDCLDQSNAWETQHCRMSREESIRIIPAKLPEYGDYSLKFYPASGHIFASVAVLMTCGYKIDSREVQALLSYIKHYLIAMQLNDDAHDWKEDLEQGQMSTAVTVLLHNWREKHPERGSINMIEDMPELEQIFWYEELAPLCMLILEHTQKSRKALDVLSSVLVNRDSLEEYIVRNEHAAHRALEEQAQSVSFVEAYVVR